jgi:dihydropteroate synthase
MNSVWRTSRFTIDLSRPRVMGIVNVTPDSFSDGGLFASEREAVAHCDRLVGEGADLLDVGGESTRPGASEPSAEEELARVLPVLRHALTLGVPVSVDTSEPAVMRAALELGADIVNDIRALQRPGALEAVAAHATCGVCLMHMQGEPGTMQAAPHYADVVFDVAAFLAHRRDAALVAGIAFDRIALDPGIGFGKSVDHNLTLLARQREVVSLGSPVLVGWSRKSTLGSVTGRAVDQRLHGSIAAALMALERGARVLRVHDVSATVDAVKVWCATIAQEENKT